MNELSQLRDILLEHTGIDLHAYNINFIKRRLEYRLNAKRLSLKDYLSSLENDSKEIDELLKSLSINVTEFFRDIDVFSYFGEILRSIKKASVNIWSAACATGEEPYTISMIATDANKDCKIIATDINRYSIEYAIKGIYPNSSLRKIPPYMLKYFTKYDDHSYAIKEEVKKRVRFEVGDIFRITHKERFDFIFCRNTMIYFSSDKKGLLLKRFHEKLEDGGYLVIGKSEALLGESLKLFRCINPQARFYKRL